MFNVTPKLVYKTVWQYNLSANCTTLGNFIFFRYFWNTEYKYNLNIKHFVTYLKDEQCLNWRFFIRPSYILDCFQTVSILQSQICILIKFTITLFLKPSKLRTLRKLRKRCEEQNKFFVIVLQLSFLNLSFLQTMSVAFI